jgi:hypothetical protein
VARRDSERRRCPTSKPPFSMQHERAWAPRRTRSDGRDQAHIVISKWRNCTGRDGVIRELVTRRTEAPVDFGYQERAFGEHLPLRRARGASQTGMTATTLEPAEKKSAIAYSRLLITLVLAVYAIPLMRHPEDGSLLDSVDLAIHETGHLVFAPCGEVLQFAGGTLFQLIVPAAFVVYFARRHDRHAATVPLWWIGQNFWNISVYVRDARAQELPLVGGGEHDWAYLLGHFHLLAHDQGIGRTVHSLGVMTYLVAVLAGMVFAMAGRAADGVSPDT